MNRIRKYFNSIADELEIKAKRGGLTNNKSDIGHNREHIANDFLNNHLPRRLEAILGGTIFGNNAPESKQIDIIVCNDLSINFKQDKKMFTAIESVASAITVKSTLDKAAIIDCLNNLASIPQIDPTILSFKDDRKGIFEKFIQYHPSLFIFAFKGIAADKILEHIQEHYKTNTVPENRKPSGIIVNKKYIILRNNTDKPKTTTKGSITNPGEYQINDLTSAKQMEGFPFVHLMNSFCSYVDWLTTMRISIFRHFNAGFGFKDK